MKHLVLLILLLTLLGCNLELKNKEIKLKRFSNFISADSVKFVLLTKDFPNEGWDYEYIDSIPVYSDSIFSCWTDDKQNIEELISSFPPIEDTLNLQKIVESCDCYGYNKFVFFCNNSIATIIEGDYNLQISSTFGYYKVKDTFNFSKLKHLLGRKVYHKQRFDSTLTDSDKKEINLDYNKFLSQHISNGIIGNPPVFKTSWYFLK